MPDAKPRRHHPADRAPVTVAKESDQLGNSGDLVELETRARCKAALPSLRPALPQLVANDAEQDDWPKGPAREIGEAPIALSESVLPERLVTLGRVSAWTRSVV